MSLDNIIGFDENLPVSYRNDVYSAIDSKPLYASQSYKGKVVLVTGASRGIGQETALQYARAGASLAIVSRNEESLNETRDAILSAASEATRQSGAEAAVQKVLERFERLDILIDNAGFISVLGTCKKKEKNRPGCVVDLFRAFEVNIRGLCDPRIKKGQGYIVALSTVGAQLRIPGSSHAVNRLVGFNIPSVRAFALAPGFVPTRLGHGRPSWFYSANWDIAEVERDWKDLIVQEGGLINKLYIPSV
ncbi:hypothetical protein B0F90DRAFT_1756243 [Multifurca ochricompacta]|uniref:NAD(P)-binding protein n=1 Tax=Multifurca ochricompacta TaxID=376703 RepID=A0AAD4LYM5_9AGAM|nr:hypothetical protein B0F90DRAFT_1756243 [Multifurca ochricompacta]